MRAIAKKFIDDLPQDDVNELYEELNHGIDQLTTEPQMLTYLYSFGKMHQFKLNRAFEQLPDAFLQQPEIRIVDYGCGQAIGTMCYADFLADRRLSQTIKSVTLIEPSEICLKRAALHVSQFFPNAEIHTVCKTFDNLTADDLANTADIPTLHILSNVLDIQKFDLEQFANLIANNLNNYNQFVCVGPYFNYSDKDERMTRFAELLNGNVTYSKFFERRQLNPEKDWTAQIVCFDVDNELKKYWNLAEHDDAIAQYKLGRIYCEKRKNYSEAYKWFKLSANQNNDDALVCLGCCYRNGYGIHKNFGKALENYLKSAKQNNRRAQRAIGICYENGQGVKKDYQMAVEWYTKAAEQGDAGAQFDLGVCYGTGQGIVQDYQKAVEWLAKAAEQGYAGAQFGLGYFYYFGKGVEQDYQMAVEWYTKAAEQGNETAQCHLGVCYEYGQGVEKDYQKAVKWYTKAAEQGYETAQCCLGDCYYHGQGVKQNYKKAVEWYTKAAEQGNETAQNNLGVCYENGLGVEKNYQKAVEWYTKAAEQGKEKAKNNFNK
ncbi:MAG: SEL1-like repeat protein [Salinivirgaceae bacterium]|nr:SEL1-like repeat protein [Salinivirgaceae bacterium]